MPPMLHAFARPQLVSPRGSTHDTRNRGSFCSTIKVISGVYFSKNAGERVPRLASTPSLGFAMNQSPSYEYGVVAKEKRCWTQAERNGGADIHRDRECVPSTAALPAEQEESQYPCQSHHLILVPFQDQETEYDRPSRSNNTTAHSKEIADVYITLCCCAAEITSALPFAGGAYGLSRCTLGFFPGFFIGYCETLEYITYVATTTISLAEMIVKSKPSLDGYQPLIWLLFYVSTLWIHIVGDRLFWRFNLVIGGISFFIVLVFCFGSLVHVDWGSSTSGDPYLMFVDDLLGFIKMLPIAAWFFVGVEAFPLSSDDTKKPKSVVPVAQIACVVSLFVTGTMVLFITVTLPNPGGIEAISADFAPMNNGLIKFAGLSEQTATLLSIPATYATAFGFIWCYGKLIQAMATSRLLPPMLANVSPRYGTPHIALIAGSILGYAICLVVYLNS